MKGKGRKRKREKKKQSQKINEKIICQIKVSKI